MKRVLFLLSVLVSVVSSSAQVELEECVVDAFNYLNAVRQNPSAYSGKIGVDLGEVEPRPALQWNESLIRAAQAKAEDMAARNYFAHVDPEGNGMNVKIDAAGYKLPAQWTEDPKENFF